MAEHIVICVTEDVNEETGESSWAATVSGVGHSAPVTSYGPTRLDALWLAAKRLLDSIPASHKVRP